MNALCGQWKWCGHERSQVRIVLDSLQMKINHTTESHQTTTNRNLRLHRINLAVSKSSAIDTDIVTDENNLIYVFSRSFQKLINFPSHKLTI
jgi:hypothetical protein